jgi:hypothetical protein
MGTQENKAVVSPCMNEVLAKANVDVADDVLASFTLPDGSMEICRTMAYYRPADGKIVVNDVMSVPSMCSARTWHRRPGHIPKRLMSARCGRNVEEPWLGSGPGLARKTSRSACRD